MVWVAIGLAGTALAEAVKERPWSFEPLERQPLPSVRATDWPRERIDWFLLAAIEQAGLRPASPAAAHTLLRRVCFDLTGLPPTPEQEAAFRLQDFPELVESLLASPAYGERWGRHWLDLARYTDRTASWLNSTASAWLYRDWVVDAFNDDLPYDRFILRQLATDMLPETGPEDHAALGFLGLSPTYWKELKLPPEIIKTTVADEWEEHMDAVGRTFLGLTLGCARCHDHKTDPVTQEDYYALAGVFASTRFADKPILDEDLWKPVAKAKAEVAALEKKIATLKKKKPKDLKERIAAINREISGIERSTPHYDVPLANGVADAALFVKPAGEHGTILDYREGMARDLPMHIRGNPNRTGKKIKRRFLSAFPKADGQPRRLAQGGGRLDLAQAIVKDAAPLTARVIVNRVWRHHFGRGLVETPSELGFSGAEPSHPKLLGDLAARFVESGWSLKWLHREILLSAAWRQASVHPASEASDPENRLLARMPRRRLDVEAWRDAMLLVAGSLDRGMGGDSQDLDDVDNRRRTLYGTVHRRDLNRMLRLHDFPDPTAHAPARTPTITPLQLLFALNGPFVQKRAGEVAEDLLQISGVEARVKQAYRRLFQRHPSEREMETARDFLEGHENDSRAWTQYAQALLGSNEFLFLD